MQPNFKPFMSDHQNELDETTLLSQDEYTIQKLEEYGFVEEPISDVENTLEKSIDAKALDDIKEMPQEIVTASNVDIFRDSDEIDRILVDFKQDNWNDLTLEERKESIADLKSYIERTIGLENCPSLEFYNNDDPGDFAYVTGDGKTIAINAGNLGDSFEAADSIAHELWHAYQHQRANLLENDVDQRYRDGFDNYISPEIDFTMYQDQFVESDAREFAARIKEHINLL